MNDKREPVRIFIAYAREDDASRARLRTHLDILQRQGLCTIFWDGLIQPGEHWDERMKNELHQADIFLLLVSENFLASDYVNEVELPQVLERKNAGQAEIFPIILRDCLWKMTDLAQFQYVLHNGDPIEKTNGFAYVAELIAKAVNQKRSDPRQGKEPHSTQSTLADNSDEGDQTKQPNPSPVSKASTRNSVFSNLASSICGFVCICAVLGIMYALFLSSETIQVRLLQGGGTAAFGAGALFAYFRVRMYQMVENLLESGSSAQEIRKISELVKL